MADYTKSMLSGLVDKLESEEGFKQLPLAQQREARASLLLHAIRSDATLASDPESRKIALEQANRDPFVNGERFTKGKFDPNLKWTGAVNVETNPLEVARSVLGGLESDETREEAAKQAEAFLALYHGTRNNFMLELSTKANEAIGKLFGEKTPLWKNAYGPDASTAASLIEDSLRAFKPERAEAAIASGSGWATIYGLEEGLGVGLASAGAGLGVKASLGMKSLLMNRGASAATQAILGRAAEEAAEGIGFGVYQVAKDLTRERLGTGESLGTKWDERLGKIAASFGIGVATDVAIGLTLGAAKTALGSAKSIYAKQPSGFEGLTKELQETVDLDEARGTISRMIRATDTEPGLYGSLSDAQKRVVDDINLYAHAIDNAPELIDPTSFVGAATFARGMGFDLSVDKGKLLTKSLVNPNQKRSFSTIQRAFKWMSGIWSESDPAPVQAQKDALGVARAASMGTTLKVETQGFARPEDFAAQDAVKLLVPTSDGRVASKNVAAYSRWFLKRAGATEDEIASFKVTPKADWKSQAALPQELAIPHAVGNSSDEVAYLSKVHQGLEDYASSLGLAGTKAVDTSALEALLRKPSLDTLRPRTLEYVVENELQGKIEFASTGQVKITTPDGAASTFASLNAANGAVYKSLIDSGKLDVPEVSRLMKESYGYDLKVLPLKVAGNPAGEQVRVYAGKSLIAQSGSIGELFAQRPELVPKLPNRFAPELLFVDDTLSMLRVSRSAATGSTTVLRDLIKDFKGSWQPGHAYSTGKNGTLYLSRTSRQVFVLEDAFGSRSKFVSGKQAIKALSQGEEAYSNVVREARKRGFIVQPAADAQGGFYLHDGGDKVFRAKSIEEAQAYLKQQAALDAFPELSGYQDPVIEELEDGWLENVQKGGGAAHLEKASTWYKDGILYKQNKKGVVVEKPRGDYYMTAASGLVLPMEGFLESYAKKTKDNTFLKAFHELEASRTVREVADRKGQAIIRGVLSDSRGKLLPGKDLAYVSELLSIPQERWQNYSKSTSRPITPKISDATQKLRIFFDELGKRFNVDASKWLGDYVPRLEVAMRPGKYRPTLEGLREATYATFGGIPHEVNFFTMNFRNGLVLDSLLGEKNAYNLAMTYLTQGNKSLYMGPVWSKLWSASETLREASQKGLVPQGLQNRWNAYLEDVAGVRSTLGEQLHSELSIALTEKIAKLEESFLKGVSGIPVVGRLAKDRLASGATRSIVSSDVLGKLSSQLTLNTQGFRPWVALRNTLDLQRSGAFLGNTLVTDSLNGVLENPEYIGQLMRSGVIEDTLFSITHAADIAQSRWRELATRGLLGSDILTRAATAKAVDAHFDVGIKHLASGRWDMRKFFRKTSFDILPADTKESMINLINAGQLGGARQLAQKGMVDALMFTYRTGTGNTLSRHLIGKMFGKFQNYSFSTIDLYRRALANSSGADKFLRVAKLGANAFAVYYAAKAVGIDYNGFLPQDSVGVGGGPYFRALFAALDAGKEGVRGSLARAELMRTFLITAYPDPVRRSLVEALDLASQGRSEEAFVRGILGAPVDTDAGN
jgi:hypothetical protein